jgi:hypothetical protein
MNLEYPYYSLSYEFNKKNILQNIKDFKPLIFYEKPKNLNKNNLSKFIFSNKNNKQYFIIKENFLKTEYINSITDYFSEKVRVKCKFGNKLSPLEYWTKYKIDIIKETQEKYHSITIHNLRETIYNNKLNIKLCNNFRITVALTILNYFKPNSWLDISAGWGDRLLSAIFCKIKYYEATDPNLDMHSCYDNMIQTFIPKSKQKNYIIHKNGFIEAQFKKKDFDIVFSSPPFFTLEIYSKHKENSVVQFRTEKEWCDNFFLKTLIKSYNLLKAGGYMILYMGGSRYVMDTMFRLSNIMDYKGIIYFYEKKPRSIYVWQKKMDKDLYNINIL